MSIWDMSGADLAREIGQPAPVAVLRGGHADGVAGILSQIAALPPKDRDGLLAAFQAALRHEPKRIGGGNTFKGADDFYPAFNAAREACTAARGSEWYLDPAASLKARVPPAWVALKGEMGTWRSPRDVNFPRAEYWPGGVLPAGPEYAEHGPVCPVGGAWTKRRAENMLAQFPTMARHAFALEPTPEDIGEREAA